MEKTDMKEAVTRHNSYLADQMVEFFEQHSVYNHEDGSHHLSLEGSHILGDFFDTVYINYREEVFGLFIRKLEEKGITFRVDDMQQEGTIH